MVKSLMNPSVSYGESVAIGQDDMGYEGAIFEADYEGLDLKIVAGRGALAEDDLDIVFYPAYLVVKDAAVQKIGYLEGSARGDDAEIDTDQYLDKLADLKLNIFVSKQRLEELIQYETELTADSSSVRGVSTKKNSGQSDNSAPVSSVDDSQPLAKTAAPDLPSPVEPASAPAPTPAVPKRISTPKRASAPKKSGAWLDKYLDTTGFTDVECGAQGDCFFFSLFTALASDPSKFESYKSEPGVRGKLFKNLDLAKWNGMAATKKRSVIKKAREAIAQCYPLQSLEMGSSLYREALGLSKALPSQIKTKKSEVEKAEKKLTRLESTKPKDADKRATEVQALKAIMEDGRSELESLNEQKIQAQLDMSERKHFKQIDDSQDPAARRTQFAKNIVGTNKVGAYRWSEVDETMIATIEDLLNVKCIILSEPSTVNCGLAIDGATRDAECPRLGVDREGDNVGPKGYVLLNFKEGEEDSSNHYTLFARTGPGNEKQSLFEFEDLPKTLVSAIVDSCVIGPSGTITESAYSSIPAFYGAAAGTEEAQADLVTTLSKSTQQSSAKPKKLVIKE